MTHLGNLALLGTLLCACASRPAPMLGVGVSSPPGRNRNLTAPPTERVDASPAPMHGTAPLPRHDPEAPGETGSSVEAGPLPSDEPVGGPRAQAGGWSDPSQTLGPTLAAFRDHSRPLRVIQLGDSHTEGEALTGPLRRALWRRFGDGGRGFVAVAGAQWDVTRNVSVGWQIVRSNLRGAQPNGIGLARAIAATSAASMRFATCTACPGGRSADRVSVYLRPRPDGGTLQVMVDDDPPRAVSGRDALETQVAVADGPHTVLLRPLGDGPVEVLGVAFDREGVGARLEAAGVVGAQAVHLAAEDRALLAAQVAARAPTLVVLAYGTNESVSTRRNPDDYAAALASVSRALREAHPGLTMAYLGPPDTELRAASNPGTWIAAPNLDALRAAGLAVAASERALYVDLRAMMGGVGAMYHWANERPALAEPDHIHLTARGYARLAEGLAEGLAGPSPRGAP